MSPCDRSIYPSCCAARLSCGWPGRNDARLLRLTLPGAIDSAPLVAPAGCHSPPPMRTPRQVWAVWAGLGARQDRLTRTGGRSRLSKERIRRSPRVGPSGRASWRACRRSAWGGRPATILGAGVGTGVRLVSGGGRLGVVCGDSLRSDRADGCTGRAGELQPAVTAKLQPAVSAWSRLDTGPRRDIPGYGWQGIWGRLTRASRSTNHLVVRPSVRTSTRCWICTSSDAQIMNT